MPPSTRSSANGHVGDRVDRVEHLARLPRGRLERRARDVARRARRRSARRSRRARRRASAARTGPRRPARSRRRRCRRRSRASSSTSAAERMIPSRSRSHCTAAPVDRDRALEHVAAGSLAELVGDASSAARAMRTGSSPVLTSRKRAGAVGVLRLAAARSRSARTARPAGRRAMPATGRAAERGAARLAVDLAGRADLGQQRARDAHQLEARLVPVERLAGPSAACGSRWSRRSRGRRRRPAGEVPQQPASRSCRRPARRSRARSRAPGTWSSSQRDLGPGEVGRQRQARRASRRRSRPASPASSRTSASVRVSCQTIALWTGSPVARSHTTVVSRWLVMPIAATSPASRAGRSASAPPITSRVRAPDLARVVLDPARLRVDLLRARAGRRAAIAPVARRTGSGACWSCPGRSLPGRTAHERQPMRRGRRRVVCILGGDALHPPAERRGGRSLLRAAVDAARARAAIERGRADSAERARPSAARCGALSARAGWCSRWRPRLSSRRDRPRAGWRIAGRRRRRGRTRASSQGRAAAGPGRSALPAWSDASAAARPPTGRAAPPRGRDRVRRRPRARTRRRS